MRENDWERYNRAKDKAEKIVKAMGCKLEDYDTYRAYHQQIVLAYLFGYALAWIMIILALS